MEVMETGSAVESFITKFHNLDGITIAEKQKNFSLLLRDLPPDTDSLITLLKPLNFLETGFKLKILIKLQRIPELFEILKSGDEYLTAKILKNKWFCQKLAESNSSFVVHDILPYLSYVMRLRLLKRLEKYGNNLDSLFDTVQSKYGIHIAYNLLMACSYTKIENLLEYKELNSKRLLLLYQKYPDLCMIYMRRHYLKFSIRFLSLIYQRNVEDFSQIVKTKKTSGNLGKRLTKKFVNLLIPGGMKDASEYCTSLHLKTTIKVLGTNFEQFYFNCFPASSDDVRYNFVIDEALVKILGTQKFYDLFREGFKHVYNKDLNNFPELIEGRILEELNLDEREKWIKIKKENGSSEDDLIKYMGVKDSIPLIKAKINLTSSIQSRVDLIQVLLDSCKINKDLDALADVLDYICLRHRNDEILSDVLVGITNSFPLENLEKRHWISIQNIMKIIKTKLTQVYGEFGISLKYIEFLFNQNELIDEALFEYFKSVIETHWNYPKNEALEKVFIIKLIEFMPSLVAKDSLKLHDLKVLRRVLEWNRQHPQEKLGPFDNPRLLASLRESIDEAVKLDEYNVDLINLRVIIEYILQEKNDEIRNEMINKYFLLNFRYYNLKIDLYLLKHQPQSISDHFSKFMDHVLESYHPNLDILNFIKKYSNFAFLERAIKHCLPILKAEPSKKLFLVLGVLMPIEDFLIVISPYQPTDRVNEDDDDGVEKKIMDMIAPCLKYTTSAKVLPALIQYCRGDFLRDSLESLYFLFYHLPENQLSGSIAELSSKAVSVRKHSIFLTCTIGSVEDVQNLISKFLDKERNLSILKHLFTATHKYFVKNSTDSFFEILNKCIGKLDQNDKESFDILINLSRIGSKYKIQYLYNVWKILQQNNLHKYRSKFIRQIPDEVYTSLELEFILQIIEENFLNEGSSLHSNDINEFVVNSLHKSKHLVEVFTSVFRIVSKFVPETFQSIEQEILVRRSLHSFVRDFLYKLCSDDEQNHEVIRLFYENWHALFGPKDFIEEHLYLSLVLSYWNSGKDLVKFTTAFGSFYNDLINIYGIIIADMLAEVVKDSFNRFIFQNITAEAIAKFCLNFIKDTPKLEFYLLVIKLLPDTMPKEENLELLFNETVKVLKAVPLDSVQMLLNRYIMNLY